MISESEAENIAAAIKEVEAQTDAELVTVLARKADNYYYIPLLWAALLALATPLMIMLSPFWLEPLEIFLAQAAVFVAFALLGRVPAVTQRIIPRAVRDFRAQNLARRQFLEQNLHHTERRLGVLLFVSEMEHFVEILADSGVAAHVPNERWQTIVDEFTHHVQIGDTEQGFIRAVQATGAILREVAPASAPKDELPNHLVLID